VVGCQQKKARSTITGIGASQVEKDNPYQDEIGELHVMSHIDMDDIGETLADDADEGEEIHTQLLNQDDLEKSSEEEYFSSENEGEVFETSLS
jgi:hypothetical protein